MEVKITDTSGKVNLTVQVQDNISQFELTYFLNKKITNYLNENDIKPDHSKLFHYEYTSTVDGEPTRISNHFFLGENLFNTDHSHLIFSQTDGSLQPPYQLIPTDNINSFNEAIQDALYNSSLLFVGKNDHYIIYVKGVCQDYESELIPETNPPKYKLVPHGTPYKFDLEKFFETYGDQIGEPTEIEKKYIEAQKTHGDDIDGILNQLFDNHTPATTYKNDTSITITITTNDTPPVIINAQLELPEAIANMAVSRNEDFIGFSNSVYEWFVNQGFTQLLEKEPSAQNSSIKATIGSHATDSSDKYLESSQFYTVIDGALYEESHKPKPIKDVKREFSIQIGGITIPNIIPTKRLEEIAELDVSKYVQKVFEYFEQYCNDCYNNKSDYFKEQNFVLDISIDNNKVTYAEFINGTMTQYDPSRLFTKDNPDDEATM